MGQALKAVLIVFFFIIFCLPLVLVGNPESPVYEKLQVYLRSNKPLDYAIVGDSRAHTGISPAELSLALRKATGLNFSGYNFAVDGTDVIHHYSFIRNALLTLHKKPKVVLWTPNPLHFNAARVNNRLEQLKFSDVLPLATAGAPFETLLDIITMAYFKPWQHKPIFSRIVSDYSERVGLRTIAFQQKILGLEYVPEKKSREYISLSDGQEPFTILDWDDRFRRGATTYMTDYAKLNLSDWHFRLAALLAKDLRQFGVQLVILEMPVSRWFQARLAASEKHQAWRNKMKHIAADNNAIYLDHSGLITDGGDRVFGDPGHMPAGTASLYSKELGTVLASKGIFTRDRGGD